MALIQLRKPWTEQPQYAVGFNSAYPRPRRLILPSVGLVDLAERAAVAPESNPTGGIRVGAGGRGWYGEAASDSAFTVQLWSDITGAASAVIVQQRIDTASCDWLELGASGTTDHFPFSGAIYTDAFWGSRWCNGVSSSPINLTRPHVVAMAVKSGSQRMFVDGALFHSNTLTGTLNVPATGYLGGIATRGNNSRTYLVALFDTFLSDAQLSSISRNPYSIFADRTISIPLAAAAGGAPTISALSARLITATSAQPRISYS